MGEPRETAYLSRWAAGLPKGAQVFYNVRIGRTPGDPALRQVMKSLLKEIDALVLTDGELWLVEAKIVRQDDALGKLKIYRDRLYQDPDWGPVAKGKTLKLVLLTPVAFETFREDAARAGVELVVWPDPEATQYWRSRTGREVPRL